MAPGVARLNPNITWGPHIQYSPRRQYRHVPQGTICSATTRSSTEMPQRCAASSSSCTTRPTNSCPGTTSVSAQAGRLSSPQNLAAPW